MALVVEDVTELKSLEERLGHRALQDPLTGLPNRTLFSDRLEHAFSRAERHGSEVAVLFLDLDDFKLVNYSLGHEAGDSLLVGISGRILSWLGPGDTAAYLSGDEFAVLLENTTRDRATRVAGRFVEALREPFVIDDREVFITASVGIALGGDPARRHPMDLLRNAELAMYQAKENGKAHHKLFEEAMNARVLRHFEIRNELRRAVSAEEFTLHYQPKIELVSGRPTMMEALVRWEHPERGLVFPGEFLPVAEETGLIVPLGRWVLGEACRQAKRWQELYPSAPPIAVCVNISARQFHQANLVEDVAGALEGAELEPGSLSLEITEDVAVDEATSVADTFEKLKGLRVRFVIDDFGTGHSSLSYLTTASRWTSSSSIDLSSRTSVETRSPGSS
jgi:diguanylate cyclase (GGDEF)-like protein